MHCPLCGTCDIGKVGTTQFYCWNCLLEFTEEEGKIKFYQVEPDGTLLYIDLETAIEKQYEY